MSTLTEAIETITTDDYYREGSLDQAVDVFSMITGTRTTIALSGDGFEITSTESGRTVFVSSEGWEPGDPEALEWTILDEDFGTGAAELITALHGWAIGEHTAGADEAAIHSDTLTSPDGEQSIRVTWMQERVTGVHHNPDQADPIAWDADQCPVQWDEQEHRASNIWELTDFPVSYSGDGHRVMQASQVDSLDELTPGTYFLEEL